MGRGKPWDLLTRTKVIALHEIGKSVREIVNQTNVSRATVFEYLRRFRAEQKVPEVKKRDCQPRKVTLGNIRIIASEIKRFPRSTARMIKLKNASLSHLSIRTINRIIRLV